MKVTDVVKKYIIKDLGNLVSNYYLQKESREIGMFGCWDRTLYGRFCSEEDKQHAFTLVFRKHWLFREEFAGACHSISNRDFIKKYIKSNLLKDDDLRSALYRSCRKGNIDVFQLLFKQKRVIEIFENDVDPDWSWNRLFGVACEGGNTEIIRMLGERGVVKDWGQGLCEACANGNMENVQYVIEKGADNWNGGLYFACGGGHMEIIKLMLQKKEYSIENLEDAFRRACESNQIDVIRFMMKLIIEKGGVFDDNEYWNDILHDACYDGHLETVKFVIEQGANVWNRSESPYNRHEEIREYLATIGTH